ncbi:MAG: HrgC protein [candidate division KSB1 bacterium]|nr:HrgC protein [candidate division KSB1 bacterium]
MKINLKHNQTGAMKEVKLGFSWTTLFFGALVPLFRGDLKWFVIMFLVSIITFGIAWLIFPFIYNKIYIKELMEKGYIPANDTAASELQSRGIMFKNM